MANDYGEERYTLDEARAKIALEECREHGHSWDVDEVRTYGDPAGTPIAVRCTNCGETHRIAQDDTVSVTEAAQILGVTRQAVLDRISRSTLPAEKAGRDYAIPRAALVRTD